MLSDDPPKPESDPKPRVDPRPTVRLDPRDLKPSWPIAVASLEQLTDWAVFALRLGTLALIQECVRDLAQRDAKAETVERLRQLVEAIAHMPCLTDPAWQRLSDARGIWRPNVQDKPTKKTSPKKPLTISIHGDGIDIDASFASGVPDFKSLFENNGKPLPFSMSSRRAARRHPPGQIDQHRQHRRHHRTCPPEDLGVITAAITARHTWDAKEAAAAADQPPAPDNHQS